MNRITTRKLPVEGALLEELSLQGNGKDCVLRLATTLPKYHIHLEMRDPRLMVEVRGRALLESFNHGDSDLGLRYRPREPVRVASVELDLCSTDDEWDEDLARFAEGRREFLAETAQVVRIVLEGCEEVRG